MNKQILLDYANLKIQAKDIETKLDFLKPEVLKQVAEIKGDSNQPVALSELPGYSYTIYPRKTWKYSDKVSAKKIELDTMKATEEATGAATYIETQELKFNPPRD